MTIKMSLGCNMGHTVGEFGPHRTHHLSYHNLSQVQCIELQVYTMVLIIKLRCTNTVVNYTYCMNTTVVCSPGSCLFRWAWPTPTIPTSLGYKQSHEGKHTCQLTWRTPRGMILYARWWWGRGQLLGRCNNWQWLWHCALSSVITMLSS